jgi:hypothetical protein
MSLSDAKRLLQWNVVTEALVHAGVDAEVIALVEQARHVSDTVHSVAQVLLGGADVKQTRNYVKVEMVGMLPPFERAYVELVRPGGKTSHELREMLRDRLSHIRKLLADGSPTDGMREGIIQGTDEDLARESP